MRLFRRKRTEGGNKTPAWIVSFTDMITLLLSFFIMLQALAKEPGPELFFRSQGSFRRAIAGFGIPEWIFGKKARPSFQHRRPQYPMEEGEGEHTPLRVISEQDEKVRKLFEQLRRLAQAKASDYEGTPARLITTPVRFEPQGAELEPEAKAFLKDFAGGLLQGADLSGKQGGAPSVHVIGLAPDEADPKDQWALSSQRARAVQQFLRDALPEGMRRAGTRIDAWGAGAGRRWTGDHRPDRLQRFILLAVMESEPRK